MKALWGFRWYQLRYNRVFWGLSAVMVAAALLLCRAPIIPADWKGWNAIITQVGLKFATDKQAASWYRVQHMLGIETYTLLIPAVLTAWLLCTDVSESHLPPVLCAGHSGPRIALVETGFIMVVTVLMFTLIQILNLLFYFKDYRAVVTCAGAWYLVRALLLRIFLELGNISLFLILGFLIKRAEIILALGVVGAVATAFETEVSDLLAWLPTAVMEPFLLKTASWQLLSLYLLEAGLLLLSVWLLPPVLMIRASRR